MARAQFEYDEVGNTFYYVIVSFFAVIVFPLTHFLWPSLPKKGDTHIKFGCRCDGDLAKKAKLDAIKPWEKTKRILKAIVLIVVWAIFLLFIYKVTQIKHENTEYDPYKILEIDPESDLPEIKRRYRELSKLHHPDKGGDAQTFDTIVKAYKALTDEETRQNWKLHGNPDGPRGKLFFLICLFLLATTFGIALPKWIVSEQYGIWVLALYGLIFMGVWWYNSMKYSADKVLLETTRIYYHFLQKTPYMEINRILMVLAGSYEFWKRFNNEIIERESDDIEVPRVMKELKNLCENKKEQPFCYPWSVKARTLLHAYLTRNRVINCQDLADLKETKRRALLNTVNEEQYEDIVYVLSMMPKLEVEAHIEVQGEEDRDTVTVGSVVTLKITLKRNSLLDLEQRENEIHNSTILNPSTPSKPAQNKEEKIKEEKVKPEKIKAEKVEEKIEERIEDSEKDDNDDSSIEDEEDDEISQELLNSKKVWDDEPTTHHEVHCPYYPLVKYEWWYLYLVERKTRRLASMVVPCKTLDKEKTIELKFSAPPQKGIYYFTLNVRSDSYFDSDYSVDVKMEVHAARDPPVVKYEDTEDEDEDKNSETTEDYTEGSDSELEE